MPAVLLAAIVCHGAFAKGNQKALKAQAKALLAKSHSLSNLESPGSSPFVLTANVQYTEDGKSGSGQAEIDWLGPEHWREVLSAPGYSYISVIKGGKQYLSRTGGHLPLLVYELLRTLATAVQSPTIAPKKIKKVTTRRFGNAMLICPERNPEGTSLTVCLDEDGDVVSVDRQWPPELSALDWSYQYSNFAAFGLHRFPLSMKFQGGDGHEVDVTVLRIAPNENVAPQDFAVPVGSAEQAWCAELKTSESPAEFLNATKPPLSLGIHFPRVTVFYIEVGADGRPRAATLMHSSEPIEPKELEQWVSQMHFPVFRCGSDGVEYQTETSFKVPQLPVF